MSTAKRALDFNAFTLRGGASSTRSTSPACSKARRASRRRPFASRRSRRVQGKTPRQQNVRGVLRAVSSEPILERKFYACAGCVREARTAISVTNSPSGRPRTRWQFNLNSHVACMRRVASEGVLGLAKRWCGKRALSNKTRVIKA